MSMRSEITDFDEVVKVTLNPGHKMNYHSHERRDEVRTVVSGSGQVSCLAWSRASVFNDALCLSDYCQVPVVGVVMGFCSWLFVEGVEEKRGGAKKIH